jgi:hypothetical protein
MVDESLSGTGRDVGRVKYSLGDDLGIVKVELVEVKSVDAREQILDGLPHEVEVENELPR